MSCYAVEDGSWQVCTLSLRTGTIIIGWLDIIYAIIRGIVATVRLGDCGGENGISAFSCGVFVTISLLALLEFIVSFTLLWGVRNRLFPKIQLWAPAQKILLILYLLVFILLCILRINWVQILFLIIFHPVIIYFIPVVSSYAESQNDSF
ncbi:uncharacterized protein LOC111046388 [Nilaparvata lugens]|uniref:uncharacterized protein LOC111046388 n=1 Tax=Nilaparvata lugens TaxID=108931 RepID=UPI000B9866C3|nr:uncharacterized protein LOC111046388 [Nilaparvata lugens]XP_022187613.1 uncharacterized protein LOC111046388 [Nilaparvata lugens]XP_039293934.1 uncharacterized protein LOC111046388 [Nilaparvata lugens]